MARGETERQFKPGDFVRLSVEAKLHRITEMEKWEGTVEDVREFTCRARGTSETEHFKWVVVNWGYHREGKPALTWLEKAEHLTLC